LAVFISGILGTHAIETTPITKNCNQSALRALVARSLVTGARLVAEQIIASIGEFGLHLAVAQPESTFFSCWSGD
jgi:hypothetical protein